MLKNIINCYKCIKKSGGLSLCNGPYTRRTNPVENLAMAVRYKYTSKKLTNRTAQDDEEDSDNDENDIQNKDVIVKSHNLGSLRADLLLKTGLGIARNKIEEMFYESRVRVNGRKIMKKSQHVGIGDELDLIKGLSPKNKNFLIVGRIEVLNASPRSDGEGLTVKLRKSKSLIIENYEEENKWQPSS